MAQEQLTPLQEVPFSQARARWARPCRLVFAVAVDAEGKADIITLGWKTMVSSDPPMVAVAIGKGKHSHQLISESREFVFAVPGEDLHQAALYCGTHSGRLVDKFKEAGLTKLPAKYIKAPLIAECIINLECKLAGQMDTGDHTIFVGEVVNAWVADDDRRPLLTVGEEGGYDLLGIGGGFRFGAIKR